MKTWRAHAGYSLLDLLVATAAMGLVMAGLLTILRSGTTTYRWGAARVEAQQSARAALERMAKELRGAGYDPTSAGIAPIVIAEPARVAFQWDLDGDGVVDPTRERVTFVLRPGESILRRDAGGGAQPIINGVKRFVADLLRCRRARHDRSRRRRLHPHSDRGRARRPQCRDAHAGRSQKPRRVRDRRQPAPRTRSSRARPRERDPASLGPLPNQRPTTSGFSTWPSRLRPTRGPDMGSHGSGSRAAPGPRSSSRPTPRNRPGSSRSTPGSPRRSATTLRPADPAAALRGGAHPVHAQARFWPFLATRGRFLAETLNLLYLRISFRL